MTAGPAALLQTLRGTVPVNEGKRDGSSGQGESSSENDFMDLLKNLTGNATKTPEKGDAASQLTTTGEGEGEAPAGADNLTAETLEGSLDRVISALASKGQAKDPSEQDATVPDPSELADGAADTLVPNDPQALAENLAAVLAQSGQKTGGTQVTPQQQSASSNAKSSASQAAIAAANGQKGEDDSNMFGDMSVDEFLEVSAARRAGDMSGEGSGETKSLADATAGTVKIVRQETHFAPTMRLSPIQQVGEQIKDSLQSTFASRGAFDSLATRTEGPVLKTLEIQLQPMELGTVKVSMRVVGDSVEVAVQAAKAETAELLKRDQVMLDQMLRSTGYKADVITIQAAGEDRVTGLQTVHNSQASGQSSNGQQGSNFAGDQGAQQGFEQTASGEGGRSNGGSRDNNDLATAAEAVARGENGEELSEGRRDGGVYL